MCVCVCIHEARAGLSLASPLGILQQTEAPGTLRFCPIGQVDQNKTMCYVEDL